MKRICPRIAIFPFIAAMVLAGCGKKEKAAPPPPPQPPPPVVAVTKAVQEQREAPGFQAIAILEGSTQTEVHARVAGYLIRQAYQEGAAVKQGDLLFEMDARPFQAALDRAKATLADKQAPRPGPARSAARAEIDAAQAAVTAAQADLDATKIAAPVGGIAGGAGPGMGASPGPGDWIAPGTGAGLGTPLTTISTVDPIKAVFTLPKKFYLDNSDRIAQILALAPEGRPETIELLLSDGTPYSRKGRWDSVDRPASASSGPVACALFPNPDRVLRPGQYVKVGEGKP